jgi:hypothetical protein
MTQDETMRQQSCSVRSKDVIVIRNRHRRGLTMARKKDPFDDPPLIDPDEFWKRHFEEQAPSRHELKKLVKRIARLERQIAELKGD